MNNPESDQINPIYYLYAFIIVALILALYVWSLRWTYRDANARGKSGFLVAFLVAILSWPLGLIAWLVFRPEKRRDANSNGPMLR